MSSSAKKKAKPKAPKPKGKAKAPERKKPVKEVAEKPKAKLKKTRADKKEVLSDAATKPAPALLGSPPVAMVSSRHLDSMHEREAKGFSVGELASARVDMKMARREDISVDARRRSVLERNVEALKAWLGSTRAAPKSKVAVAVAATKK